MINIAEKTEHIGFYVTKNEFKTITENAQKYGFKSRAEYIRGALNFFNERRFNASKNNELNIIQECISLLEEHKKNVQNTMLQQSLQELQKNIANQQDNDSQNLQGNDEKLAMDLQGTEENSLQEIDENLQAKNKQKKKKDNVPFENVIQTLIRITHAKGKPSENHFKFQASRCGKSPQELMDYYDENYDFFVREADKYH